MSEQRVIYNAVKQRGYIDGYTPQQLAARQAAKIIEEAAELLSTMSPHFESAPDLTDEWFYLRAQTLAAAKTARALFDRNDWNRADVVVMEDAPSEAADCAVVLFTLAETLGIDLAQMAAEKAESDVKRGVR